MRGHVRERGKGNWYAVLSVRDPGTGKRRVQWRSLPGCKGKREAQIECSRLINEIATGSFVVSNKTTLAEWIEHWLSIGAPGKKREAVGNRSLERYGQLLRVHVKPALGNRPLQKLQSTEIDALYARLGDTRTARHVHNTLGACLGTAARTHKIARNPMLDVAKVPSPGEPDHGMALDSDQLRTLVQGFKGTVFFPIVAVAAFTGARRNEILALRWEDFDSDAKTLRIERAIEHTAEHGRQKGPKTDRGKRTIEIDDDLVALLRAERDRHLRMVAGVPDGVAVDLSLVKLPEGALIFPCPPASGEQVSFTKLRRPRDVTRAFKLRAAKLGFPAKLRLHDLRGTHETLLLDAGVPVHVVAARCGHDPAVLLRSYAKRTRKADKSAAAVIGSISRGVLS